MNAERQKLIDQLAEQDRRFGQEIAEYRRNVASIANSPDPRKKAALERYAAGDRRGAYAALRDIQLAENKAVAAGWREIASLGLDLKDRGESTTDQVISDLEVVKWLDPEDGWVLIELTRLYIEAGRLEDARRAAEEGLKRATGERDRAAGSLELANLLVKLGDYEKARDCYQAAVDLFRGLAKADPSNPVFLRDLSASLFHFANLLMQQRDMASARKNLTESLAIATFLARQPLSSTTSEQDLSAILIKMGDLLALQDDLVLARRFYEQTLDINNRLARKSPSSVEAKYELTVTFDRLGNVSIREGRQQEARASFEKSLKIRERLASVDSSNAQFQHGLLVSHVQMFLVTRDGAYRTAATNLAKRLETEGRLAPADQAMVDLLEKIAQLGKADLD